MVVPNLRTGPSQSATSERFGLNLLGIHSLHMSSPHTILQGKLQVSCGKGPALIRHLSGNNGSYMGSSYEGPACLAYTYLLGLSSPD